MVIESLVITLKKDGIEPAVKILEHYKNFKLSLPGCINAYYAQSQINPQCFLVHAEFSGQESYENYRKKVNEIIKGKMPLAEYFEKPPVMGVYTVK